MGFQTFDGCFRGNLGSKCNFSPLVYSYARVGYNQQSDLNGHTGVFKQNIADIKHMVLKYVLGMSSKLHPNTFTFQQVGENLNFKPV